MDVEQRVDKLDGRIQGVENKTLDIERDVVQRLTKLEMQSIHLTEMLKTLVNLSQFEPVKLIAYGLAAGVLSTVLGGVMLKLGGFLK